MMDIKVVSERDACIFYHPNKEELYDMYWNKGMSAYKIADNFGCSYGSIWYMMNEYNIPKRSVSGVYRKYSINENFFKIWSYGMSYVLGYFCADGCIDKNSRFIFYSNDKELLEDIKSVMDSEHPIRKDKRSNNYYLQITYSKMVQDLMNLGITPNKSLSLGFPEVPEEYMSSFIRGVFDGDGSVYIANSDNSIHAKISSGSDKFILKLQLILNNNNIKTNLGRWNGKLCGIRISKKSEVIKFYDFIYSYDGIYLKRKKDIFDKFFIGDDV